MELRFKKDFRRTTKNCFALNYEKFTSGSDNITSCCRHNPQQPERKACQVKLTLQSECIVISVESDHGLFIHLFIHPFLADSFIYLFTCFFFIH